MRMGSPYLRASLVAVTRARRPRGSTKLTRLRSRVIDAVCGLSMIRRRESPSVHALLTSILPTGRMVVALPICSVNSESRFGAVADSSSEMGSRDPLCVLLGDCDSFLEIPLPSSPLL